MSLIELSKLKAHYAWWNDERKELFDEIVDVQPVIDAIEVIRCKDCALRGRAGCVNYPYDDYCPERFKYPEFGDEDFCSRGVRKENE